MSTEHELSSPLGRLWRLTATAFCFAGFGAGSCVLVFVLFPTLYLLPGGTDARRRRARWLIHKAFALLVAVLCATRVMRLELTGAQELRARRNALVLANHPTLIDVVVLLALIPDATCIVKSRLWRNPFVRGPVNAAGYIRNDAPKHLVEESARALRNGATLIVFPEGTRSAPATPFQFQRGAAYIALQSGADIIPVVIACDPPTLTKSHKWHDIPERTFRLRVAVKAARPLSAWMAEPTEASPVGARRLTDTFENYFMQEMRSHESLAA